VKGLRALIPSLALLGAMTLAHSANANLKGTLMIQINGLRNQNGTLCYNVFSSSQGFPSAREKAVQSACVPIDQRPLTVSVANLPAGSYAVSVYHDANGDRKLNRNSVGAPIEGYGFSNNPIVRTSAPKYGEAVIFHAGRSTNVPIQMRYD